MQSKFRELQRLANQEKKLFEVYFKFPMPDKLQYFKDWLIKNKVVFFEG